MNERILELAIKAQELAGEQHHTGRALDLKGMEQVPDFQIFMDRVHTSYEKFAELIVRECARVCEPVLDEPYEDMSEFGKGLVEGQDVAIEKIKELFGVEE